MTQDSITNAIAHAKANNQTTLDGFLDFLRIKSVSTDPAFKSEINKAADFVLSDMQRIGFENCTAYSTEGHPIVYGEWLKAGPDKPTILIYAHYDVQPADPLDLWETAPFDPTIKDGKLIARGTVDDKAGVWGNLKTFEAMLATAGELPLNVKLLFEGEEETGSKSLAPFIRANQDLLAADLLVISDGRHKPDQLYYVISTRGSIGGEVKATGAAFDVHSGLGGGIIQNPIHVISQIIASFHDADGHILVDGAYEGITPLTDEEKAYYAPLTDAYLADSRESMGDFTLWGEPDFMPFERATVRPSIDINGIFGGYQGEGGKTIIPATAGFKFNMRLAPMQDPESIMARLIDHITAFNSDSVKIEITRSGFAAPALFLREGPIIEAFTRASDAIWDQPPMFGRTGGTLPLLGMFQQELPMPLTNIAMSVGGLLHSPNEYMEVDSLHTCIATAIHFYTYLGEIDKGDIG